MKRDEAAREHRAWQLFADGVFGVAVHLGPSEGQPEYWKLRTRCDLPMRRRLTTQNAALVTCETCLAIIAGVGTVPARRVA